TAKSPLAVIPEIETETPAMLARVRLLAELVVPTAWVGNDSLAGESARSTVPMPLRLAVCGLVWALSLTVSVPVRVPRAVGLNATGSAHLVPGACELPQVLEETVKSPLAAMLEMVSAGACWFARVTVLPTPVTPTG